MSRDMNYARRRFLQRGLQVAAMGASAPWFVSSSALAKAGRVAASDQVGIGYIGAGHRANQLTDLPPAGRIVAVADVDLGRAEELAAKHGGRAYRDYRELLDAQDVDAVIIATPDHWHVLPAIHACLAAKDIYLEKPLSLTVREGRLLVEAVRKCGRVLQTGSQRRSMPGHRWGCELVRNGVAGTIHTVVIANYPSPWESQFPAQPVPDKLDWDAWCGLTEPVGFHPDIYIQRSNPGWISLRPYSGGEMTGTGAHGFDQIQWALDMDHTGPVEIWCEGGKLEPVVYTQPESRDRGDTHMSAGHRVGMRYANRIEIRLEDNGPQAGGEFIGDRGKIRIGNNEVTSNPPELAQTPAQDLKMRMPEINDHILDWLQAIKTRSRPIADVEIGHRSAILCHLGNIARWIGRPLRWDPETETFPGDEEANLLLDRPRRKAFELPTV